MRDSKASGGVPSELQIAAMTGNSMPGAEILCCWAGIASLAVATAGYACACTAGPSVFAPAAATCPPLQSKLAYRTSSDGQRVLPGRVSDCWAL